MTEDKEFSEDKRLATIDADFINYFDECGDDSTLFIEVMNEMNIKPIVHEYVFREELITNKIAKKLIDDGILHIINYEDYLNDEAKVKYEEDFRKAYKDFNYSELYESENIYKYRHAKENLGEIRTLLMVIRMGIDVIISNDGETKLYAKQKLSNRNHKINVYNVFDVFSFIGSKRTKKIKWKNIKCFFLREVF